MSARPRAAIAASFLLTQRTGSRRAKTTPDEARISRAVEGHRSILPHRDCGSDFEGAQTAALFDDIGSLLEAPLNDYARVRLGLLLYSHLTEVDAIYQILANMVEITAGERCVMDPFHDLYRPASRSRVEQYPPSAKRVVERLKERASARGLDELVVLVDWFFNDAVRNSFFHSDYILHRDEFRSREAKFVDAEGRRSSSMKIVEIVDLINRSMVFYQAFTDVYEKHRRSYREDKPVRGRIGADGSEQDVILLANEERGGLYGFRA